jgi:hypothetical protein
MLFNFWPIIFFCALFVEAAPKKRTVKDAVKAYSNSIKQYKSAKNLHDRCVERCFQAYNRLEPPEGTELSKEADEARDIAFDTCFDSCGNEPRRPSPGDQGLRRRGTGYVLIA